MTLILLTALSRVERSPPLVSSRQPDVYILIKQDLTLKPVNDSAKISLVKVPLSTKRLAELNRYIFFSFFFSLYRNIFSYTYDVLT